MAGISGAGSLGSAMKSDVQTRRKSLIGAARFYLAIRAIPAPRLGDELNQRVSFTHHATEVFTPERPVHRRTRKTANNQKHTLWPITSLARTIGMRS